jgi:hypothetical protein
MLLLCSVSALCDALLDLLWWLELLLASVHAGVSQTYI